MLTIRLSLKREVVDKYTPRFNSKPQNNLGPKEVKV
jgi:hypothetical protein